MPPVYWVFRSRIYICVCEAKKQVSPTRNPSKKNTHFWRSTATHLSAGLFTTFLSLLITYHDVPTSPAARRFASRFWDLLRTATPSKYTLHHYGGTRPEKGAKLLIKFLCLDGVHSTYQENWLNVPCNLGPSPALHVKHTSVAGPTGFVTVKASDLCRFSVQIAMHPQVNSFRFCSVLSKIRNILY